MSKINKAVKYIKEYGFVKTAKAVKTKLCSGKAATAKKLKRIIKDSYDHKEFEQLNTSLKISILMPVYNTDVDMLKCVMESVINGSYDNYELCIYDASDENGRDATKICEDYAGKFPKIKYLKGDNFGIAENTNRCFDISEGGYIALLDHDDVLHRDALCYVAMEACKGADFIYTDEVTFSGKITNVISSDFKPDYSPYMLRCNNYICHFVCFSRELFVSCGKFNKKYDGSQDHELFLRLTDRAKKVCHIPKILYFWRVHKGSVSDSIEAKEYAITAGINGVRDFLASKNIDAEVESSEIYPTIYRIHYKITDEKVSVIILNHNHYEDLKRCLESIYRSTYKNYEIIILENNSNDQVLSDYYAELSKKENIKIITLNEPFNYSRFNNIAAGYAAGTQLLFLNNDIEAVSENWIQEMLMYSQRNDVGAVGAQLRYPDKTLQHCYLITGAGPHKVAIHAGLGLFEGDYGYLDRIGFVRDVSAVTGACLMVKKDFFDKIGGFDEKLSVAYNDVDICLKIRNEGYGIIYTPYARLIHYESGTRGRDSKDSNRRRLDAEAEYIKNKWKDKLIDRYYNANFSTDREGMLR